MFQFICMINFYVFTFYIAHAKCFSSTVQPIYVPIYLRCIRVWCMVVLLKVVFVLVGSLSKLHVLFSLTRNVKLHACLY